MGLAFRTLIREKVSNRRSLMDKKRMNEWKGHTENDWGEGVREERDGRVLSRKGTVCE